MAIGERLKALRQYRKMSQGDVEKRSGLLRCYISRVENGHSVPAIETLEKIARAMDVPVYALFYDGEQPPVALPRPKAGASGWGSFGRNAQMLCKFRELLGRANEADINLLLFMAQKMALKKRVARRKYKKF